MKNYFFLILTLITITSCKIKDNNNVEEKIEETKSTFDTKIIEKQAKQIEIVKTKSLNSENYEISECSHPEYFDFKKYREYCVTDTISIDLNGNGILERIYFDRKDCHKLIIEEKGQNLISIGCGKEEYKGFPNAVGWINLWCIVSDKETFEIIVEDGQIIGDKTVNLERPSLYVGKEEAGGGIITYKKGELYWVHQSD